MKSFVCKALTAIVGFAFVLMALWMIKEGAVIAGTVLLGFGMFVVAVMELVPEPEQKKYKLKENHIEEIICEVQKDALIREVEFIDAEHAEEIIDLVDDWDFNDAMVASYAIQAKFPTLKQGREICL